MTRVLVTGANGLVGSRLVVRLAGQHEVVATARGPQRASQKVRYIEADLARPGDLRNVIEEVRPGAILHAAAMTDVDACERDPQQAWRLNCAAVEEAALAANAVSARLVALSTDYVFDGAAGPYGEDDAPNPRGAYARSKRCGEEAALLLAKDVAVARVAVVYTGRAASKRTFAAAAADALLAGKEVRAFADQRVSPTLADNAAELVIGLWQSGEQGVWHCTGRDVVTRVEFCRALARKLSADERLIVPTRLADAKLLAPRPLLAGLRVDKIQRLLGADAPLSLDEQLDRFIAERKQA